jgi:hypothetical protein
MIAVANIWLFFYTPEYGLLEQLTGLFGCRATTGSAAGARAGLPDGGDRVEGSRLLHDLLSGRAAAMSPHCTKRPRSMGAGAGTSSAA